MALDPGTRFGPYEVAELIGVGGMGEVFRATDTKLKRQVAIKVLPESFAADEGRLERFQREAEILASLNHPNIAQIYGLEQQGEINALIMELVEGPTLADRLTEGPLPPDEALAIARQIVDALEAAHELQIVHRDLKPANIKLRPDGTVKVLDFGIAKPIEVRGISGISGGGVAASIMTPAMTETGLIMGTAAYMSPEQARGRFVDQRTDVWAFGCVLFEMLTGQPAFLGEDITVTLARVIEREADLDSVSGTISPAVRRTLSLCLKKDPRQRIADIRDVRLALAGEFETVDATTTDAVRRSGLWQTTLPVGVGAALVAGLIVWFAIPRSEPVAVEFPAEVLRFTLPLGVAAANDEGEASDRFLGSSVAGAGWPRFRSLAFSNDGSMLAYSAWRIGEDGEVNSQLYLRRLNQQSAEAIPNTENAYSPFFSPDDEWLGYSVDNSIRRLSLTTRNSEIVLDDSEYLPTGNLGSHWTNDGNIVFASYNGIYRVTENGGAVEQLAVLDREAEDYRFWLLPNVLPGNQTILFHAVAGGLDPELAEVIALDLRTGTRSTLLTDAMNPYFSSATGQLLFVRRGTLMAVALNPVTVTTTGEPIVVQDNIMQSVNMPSTNLESGMAQLAYSSSGHFAYAAGGTYPGESESIIRVAPDGSVAILVDETFDYGSLRLSPDGRRLVFFASRGRASDIYIHDLDRNITQQVDTGGSIFNWWPTWSPDGRFIAFMSDREDDVLNIYRIRADLSGEPERLAPSDQDQSMASWSADGVIAYLQQGDIWVLPTDREPAPFFTSEANEFYAQFSPDGRWLAYVAGNRVYVRPYPGPGTATVVAAGLSPMWSKDGRQIIYLSSGESEEDAARLMTVDFAPGDPPEISREEPYIDHYIFNSTLPIRSMDIDADGAIITTATEEVLNAYRERIERPSTREMNNASELHLVINFIEELRQRVGQ